MYVQDVELDVLDVLVLVVAELDAEHPRIVAQVEESRPFIDAVEHIDAVSVLH